MVPTLDTMLYNIEAAAGNPAKALQFLKKLYQDTETILFMS